MNPLALLLLVAAASAKPLVLKRPPGSQIIDGTDAKEGEFPWQLSLQRFGSHSCGAVLVRSNRALTAAHCVDGSDASDFTVQYDSIDKNQGKTEPVTVIVAHEAFVSGQNDIAVLRFANDLTGTNTKTIALPSSGQDFSGKSCVISGWGEACGGGLGCSPDILQRRDITVLTDEQCQAGVSYDPTQHICVDGGDGSSACFGDSGGPCNCQTTLAGLTSYGSSTCRDGPGVYTRVASFIEWINTNID